MRDLNESYYQPNSTNMICWPISEVNADRSKDILSVMTLNVNLDRHWDTGLSVSTSLVFCKIYRHNNWLTFDKWLLHERICGSCINLRGEMCIIIIIIIITEIIKTYFSLQLLFHMMTMLHELNKHSFSISHEKRTRRKIQQIQEQ